MPPELALVPPGQAGLAPTCPSPATHLYRLRSWSEFIDLDLPLSKENTLVLIEWASLMTDSYIPNMDLIKIEIVDYDTRKISINV